MVSLRSENRSINLTRRKFAAISAEQYPYRLRRERMCATICGDIT